MSLVNVSIVGNLVRAPEQTCFASGRVKTTLIVAVNGPNRQPKGAEKGNESTDFYKVETWGKLADLAHKYLDKGNQVGVCGRLLLDHWTDKQGKDRITPVVEASQLSFPPRLRVVDGGQQGEASAEKTNPVSGELVFGQQVDDCQHESQEAQDDPDESADSASPRRARAGKR